MRSIHITSSFAVVALALGLLREAEAVVVIAPTTPIEEIRSIPPGKSVRMVGPLDPSQVAALPDSVDSVEINGKDFLTITKAKELRNLSATSIRKMEITNPGLVPRVVENRC